MPSFDRTGKPYLRPYLWLITAIGVIVPRRLRPDWRQEWNSELCHREALLADWERLNWQTKLDLLWRSLGAFRDALWLQQLRWEDEMFQDLRYGMRMMLKTPGFTLAAVLSLALGIGANTAIFSLIDAVLLKSLPVKDPEQLYLIAHAGQRGVDEGSNNFPLFEQIRDNNQSFSGVIAVNPNRWKVTVNGEIEQVSGQVVTGNYYSVLGVGALLGRTLTVDDDRVPRGHPVAVISYRYWQRRFAQAPGVLGQSITINLTPFTIIGVTPPEFFGLQVGRSTDITVPMSMHPLVGSGASLDTRGGWWQLPMLGRLKPGVTVEQARAESDVHLQRAFAESGMGPKFRKDFFERVELVPASNGLAELRKQFSAPLRLLMAVVGLVLLIACANVANLLLARATARQKEIATRLAIGASRMRLVRQLLTESVSLAVLGGLLGLFFAYWGANLLVSFIPQKEAPLVLHVDPDLRILSFAAALSLLTSILFGLAPALRATRIDLYPTLKDNARSLRGASRFEPGKVLVVFQVALSLLLLIGAGLFVRSLQNLKGLDSGFNRDNVLLFTVDCYGTGYSGARLSALHRDLIERVNAIPGVRSASLSKVSPISGGIDGRPLSVPGFVHQPEVDDRIDVNWVGTKYFETMGITLLSGRDFSLQDGENTPRVAVVSESMARHYFPNQNPLGQPIHIGRLQSGGFQVEIVGVVKDAKFESLRTENLRLVYLPHFQSPPLRTMTYALRTAGLPTNLIAAARHEVRAIGRDIPMTNVKTLAAQVDESLAQERLLATLSGLFGLLALLLACIGLYGIMAYTVARRTHEVGIRLALGAHRGTILWQIMRETLLMVFVGAAVGLAAALASTRLISSLLFGLTPTDPITIALATSLMVAVAGFAGYVPARRASGVEPMIALHYE